MIKAGTYTMDKWNDEIMPLVESGKLIEEKPKHRSFMPVFQVFAGVLIDNGRRYRCVGWQPPNSKPYVEVEVEKYETY